MFKIKEVKKDARTVLRKNYASIILVFIIYILISGVFQNPIDKIQNNLNLVFNDVDHDVQVADIDKSVRTLTKPDTEVIGDFIDGTGIELGSSENWTKGVLAVFANNTKKSGNLIMGILNSFNYFAFKNKVAQGIITAVGVLIYILLLIFIVNVVQVGMYRYLIEKRGYKDTKPSKLFFPWLVKYGAHTAWVMLVRDVYLFLWSLTIIGGIIKYQSYRMVPLIMAENPTLSAREAIDLSRNMMNGNKMHAFWLDFSFIGWDILSLMLFSIPGLVFVKPYIMLTDVELYLKLRRAAKEAKIPDYKSLADHCIDIPAQQEGEYPDDGYIVAPAPARLWIRSDYMQKYSVSSLILMFFSFAMAGWIWEVTLHLFRDGRFVNRGVMLGPWLPIYGFGGVGIVVILRKFRSRPWLHFLMTVVLCGVLEYFTSWYLEYTKGMKWWDYSGYFLNINGRICLEGLLVFALGGFAAVYLIAPALNSLFEKIPKKTKYIICGVLLAVFFADFIHSGSHPNTGEGITDY